MQFEAPNIGTKILVGIDKSNDQKQLVHSHKSVR